MASKRLAIVCTCVLVACSSSQSDEGLVEYPPTQDTPASDPSGGDVKHPSAPAADAAAPPPTAGKKVIADGVLLRGVTTDGALVFDQKLDLMVWPSGAAAPTRLVQDFDPDTDSMIIKGRFVAAWLGEDVHPSSPTFWANTGGIQTTLPKMQRDTLYAKANADDFAYLTTAATSDILHRDLWATTAGGGAGTKIVSALDMGLTNKPCRPTIAFSASDLIVGGCTDDTTAVKVVAYALDGSKGTKTILDAAAPGFVINRARSHVLVQTATTSSLRSLYGLGAPVVIDGPFRLASFSSDDTLVVYLTADGKIKRASTKAPASPTQLMSGAISVFAMSPDARFVVAATTGDPSKNSDIVALDAKAPSAAPRTIAAQNAAFVGLSKDGTSLVYLGDPGTNFDPPLFVASLTTGGAPLQLSTEASHVTLANDVVYWQEFDSTTKTSTLKAARLASPSSILTIDSNLDPFTDQLVAGAKLFVGSKLGMWEYAAITP